MTFQFNQRVLSIATYPSAKLAATKKKILEAGLKLYDFSAGDPVEPTASFIKDAVSSAVPSISQYPTVIGVPALREAIAAYVQRRFGVMLDIDSEILPCTGAKEAIYNISFILIGPGNNKDILIASQPGYFVPERSAIVSGATFYPFYLNAENNFTMDLGVLPEEVLKRTAIAWINYPNNPTGAEIDLKYLEKQVEIAKRFGILLCSDECYVDLYFGDTPPPSILQVSKENVLAFHSCSKRSGMTAYRSGFVAGDKNILKVFKGFRDTLGVATPVYTQAAATKAWADDKHVAERRQHFQKKREVLIEFFKSKKLEWVKTNAGLYFWIKAPGAQSGSEYAAKLAEKGLIVYPGEFFSKNSMEYFRIALVPALEDCKRAIELWSEV